MIIALSGVDETEPHGVKGSEDKDAFGHSAVAEVAIGQLPDVELLCCGSDLMPRPASPLISHEAVVRATIEIIDAVGLEAFSLPRLADHLGVRAPSLYHHFADKNEILTAVAKSIVTKAKMRPKHTDGEDWTDYFVSWAVNFRQAVLRHRNVAMVLVQHVPAGHPHDGLRGGGTVSP